jgi:hypothetical protein
LLHYTTPLVEQINITAFMVDNFERPDPISTSTKNETDKGVIFLKKLKEIGIIDYNRATLSQVNNWCIDTEGKIKEWFDTLHEPLYVSLTEYYYKDYKNQTLFFRLSNSKLLLYIKKYANMAGIKIWKSLIAAIIFLLGCYLDSGDHFDKFIKWIESHF